MEVLPMLKEDCVSPIEAVPGLYISGRASASSPAKLSEQGITHIISVLQSDELPNRSQAPEAWKQFSTKQIAIDDDGNEDILMHLEDVYQLIENTLKPPPPTNERDGHATGSKGRVLIHCRQGVSRSGSFVVAYLMKRMTLTYSTALRMARTSRPTITPNTGFEKQLRIYEHCNYDIYQESAPTDSPPVSSPGPDKADRQLSHANRTPKPAYTAWKRERDHRLGRGDADRSRFSSMANMAAEFGRRRLAAQGKAKRIVPVVGNEKLQDGSEERTAGVLSKRKGERDKQWQRVREMEETWNDKLIRGEVERAKERGNLETLLNEVFDSVREHG